MARLLFSSLWIPLVACGGGDRANSGECPAGEVCSDLTPEGLIFRSIGRANQLVTDMGPYTTVVGGTQTVLLLEKAGNDSTPLTHPFVVDASPAVTADANGTNTVRLNGVSAGNNYLRILDATDGTLFDRISVDAAPAASAAIVPYRESTLLSYAYAEGSRFVVELRDDSGRDLIDDSMVVNGAGQRVHWDTYVVAPGPTGTRRVTVDAGTLTPQSINIEVVSRPDRLELDLSSLPVRVGQGGRVCFRSYSGRTRVAGQAWSFTVDGAASPDVDGSCVDVDTTTEGSRRIVATAAGLTITENIVVEAGGARLLPDDFLRLDLGERAAASE